MIAHINGFWNPFLNLLEHMKAETFIRAGLDVRFTVVDKAEEILPAICKQPDIRPGARNRNSSRGSRKTAGTELRQY